MTLAESLPADYDEAITTGEREMSEERDQVPLVREIPLDSLFQRVDPGDPRSQWCTYANYVNYSNYPNYMNYYGNYTNCFYHNYANFAS